MLNSNGLAPALFTGTAAATVGARWPRVQLRPRRITLTTKGSPALHQALIAAAHYNGYADCHMKAFPQLRPDMASKTRE